MTRMHPLDQGRRARRVRFRNVMNQKRYMGIAAHTYVRILPAKMKVICLKLIEIRKVWNKKWKLKLGLDWII